MIAVSCYSSIYVYKDVVRRGRLGHAEDEGHLIIISSSSSSSSSSSINISSIISTSTIISISISIIISSIMIISCTWDSIRARLDEALKSPLAGVADHKA